MLEKMLNYFKQNGIIHDFIIGENLIGIQEKDEPNFVFFTDQIVPCCSST